MIIRHSCDTPLCCNPKHLLAGNNAANAADMVGRGRSLRGERHNMAKLSAEAVKEIRQQYEQGRGLKELGTIYGITPEHIRRIIKRESWGWL